LRILLAPDLAAAAGRDPAGTRQYGQLDEA
jgi:hypothetical protein